MTSSTKRTLANIVATVLAFIVFAIVGFIVGSVAADMGVQAYEGSTAVEILVLLVCFFVSLIVQIAIHEAGHLVFGLATGYSFVSFRVGSLMIERQRGRMRFYRYSLAGTAGQCLLRPPAFDGGNMAYKLYNMGGVIANLVASVVAFGLALVMPKEFLVVCGFVLFSMMGIVMALMNGVPLRSDKISNDASNTIDLGKDKTALYALWMQLEVNYRTVEGARLGDLPEEWFVLPPEDEWTNAMTSTLCVFYENRLMDEGLYDEAAAFIDKLRATPNKVPGIYWAFLDCDRMTVALLNREEGVVDDLWTNYQVKLMRALHRLPNVIRTEYALALLADGDRKRAGECLVKFEDLEGRYPNPGDLRAEETIMADVRDAAR